MVQLYFLAKFLFMLNYVKICEKEDDSLRLMKNHDFALWCVVLRYGESWCCVIVQHFKLDLIIFKKKRYSEILVKT
jgi:hypothetical protein